MAGMNKFVAGVVLAVFALATVAVAQKADFDGIPYGKLRVQVLAVGFQTYGEDFDIDKPKMEFTIKLKRPQGQFSIYEDHPKDSSAPQKQEPPPPDPKSNKPN